MLRLLAGPRRRYAWRMRVLTAVDAVFCAAVTGAAMWLTMVEPGLGRSGPFDTLVIPMVTVPVLFRRRAPQMAAAALGAGMVLSALPTLDLWRCGPAMSMYALILYSL